MTSESTSAITFAETMTISRIEPPVPKSLPAARLYLDDIEEIVGVLSETLCAAAKNSGDPITIRITVRDRICDDVADLPTLGTHAHTFKLSVSKGSWNEITIHGTTFSTDVDAYFLPDEVMWQVHRKLQSIWAPRNLRWRTFLEKPKAWVVALLTGVPGVIGFELGRVLYRFGGLFAAAADGAILVTYYVALFWCGFHHTTLVFRRFSEAAAVRRDRTWKVVAEVLKYVGGFVSGLVTAYLIHKYWH